MGKVIKWVLILGVAGAIGYGLWTEFGHLLPF
jgi:hypothetical protein